MPVFIVTAVARFCLGHFGCDSKYASPSGSFQTIEGVQPLPRRLVQRDHDAVLFQVRTDAQHMREGALGNHEVAGRIAVMSDDNRQPLSPEIVRDLVNLAIFGYLEPILPAGRDDRGVQRVFNPGLQSGIEERELPHLF